MPMFPVTTTWLISGLLYSVRLYIDWRLSYLNSSEDKVGTKMIQVKMMNIVMSLPIGHVGPISPYPTVVKDTIVK